MTTYTIAEAAERSGFSASTLRYYEGIGLVPPAARTDAGYRLYDDRTLDRLAFIARAKQLGCSLEEITDLVGLWDGERCGPVQRRLHDLVTEKLADARHQMRELDALTSQLHDAARRLSGPATDERCGPACACNTISGATAHEGASEPIACTLDPSAAVDRVAEWHAILDHATARIVNDDGSRRVVFGEAVDVGALARLVASEQDCCSFFSFSITVDGTGVTLDVRAPDAGAPLVDALFASTVQMSSAGVDR